jgi:hypothetical protein
MKVQSVPNKDSQTPDAYPRLWKNELVEPPEGKPYFWFEQLELISAYQSAGANDDLERTLRLFFDLPPTLMPSDHVEQRLMYTLLGIGSRVLDVADMDQDDFQKPEIRGLLMHIITDLYELEYHYAHGEQSEQAIQAREQITRWLPVVLVPAARELRMLPTNKSAAKLYDLLQQVNGVFHASDALYGQMQNLQTFHKAMTGTLDEPDSAKDGKALLRDTVHALADQFIEWVGVPTELHKAYKDGMKLGKAIYAVFEGASSQKLYKVGRTSLSIFETMAGYLVEDEERDVILKRAKIDYSAVNCLIYAIRMKVELDIDLNSLIVSSMVNTSITPTNWRQFTSHSE